MDARNEKGADMSLDIFLAFGDEIALQALPVDTHVSPNIGYISTQLGSDDLQLEYLEGDAGHAPCPSQPQQCRFKICPPSRRERTDVDRVAKSEEGDTTQAETARDRRHYVRVYGHPVLFGEQINLMQTVTRRTIAFTSRSAVQLTGSPRALGSEAAGKETAISPETRMIATESESGEFHRTCTLMPGAGVRMEGERIRYGDVMVLQYKEVGVDYSNEQHLLVKPLDTNKDQQNVPIYDYCVDTQPVVGSQTEKSRLRAIPIASHRDFPLSSTEDRHAQRAKELVGGTSAFFMHVHSHQVLSVDNKRQPCLDGIGELHITDCWSMDPVVFARSGGNINGSKMITLKQMNTFLACDSEGQLSMSGQYADDSTHWTLQPMDDVDKTSIVFGLDRFFIVNKARGYVLMAKGGAMGDRALSLSTVPLGLHTALHCFVANAVSEERLYEIHTVSDLVRQYEHFKAHLKSFNDTYGRQMQDATKKLVDMHSRPEAWPKLRQFVGVEKLDTIVRKHAPQLLAAIVSFMKALYPDCDETQPVDSIIDHDGVVDYEFAHSGGAMGLVAAILDLLKQYLFKDIPPVLFGSPLCFFGADIFLAIRGSFRLCGIVCAHSKASAQELYTELLWTSDLIGEGKFKAAEALSGLMNWPAITQHICDGVHTHHTLLGVSLPN